MNIPWTEAGELAWHEPVGKPGDYAVLLVEINAIVAFSASSRDILPTNDRAGTPTDVHLRIS